MRHTSTGLSLFRVTKMIELHEWMVVLGTDLVGQFFLPEA
jgi:hypothetical protein